MAVDDLPMPVVNFLNVIGVEWPYINEDTVMQFASLVREFGQAVQRTHDDATAAVAAAAVHGLAQAHQGASTEVMKSGWAELSHRHVTEIVDGCGILSDALEAYAGYIVVQKGIAVAELIGMAATFVADQAAAVATVGIAEAAVPVIIAAGRKLAEFTNPIPRYTACPPTRTISMRSDDSTPSDDIYRCRVCGLLQDDPPWGEDGHTASFEICACCGTEFGYEDATQVGIDRKRASWLAAGTPWFDRKQKPAHWDLDDQLAHIPRQYRPTSL